MRVSRRSFAAALLLAGIGLAASPRTFAAAGGDAPPPRAIRIALVSDTHVTRDPAKAAYGEHLDKVIPSVNEAGVDFVLIAGDLTDGGLSEQYDDFKAKIAGFKAPVRWVPGNHDVGDKHLDTKPGEGVKPSRVELFEKKMGPSFWAATLPPGIRIVGVNSSILGSGLPAEADEWALLERELGKDGVAAKQGLPLVIVQHYPLFQKTFDEPGGGYWNLEPAARQRYLSLLTSAAPHIPVVLSAHLHRPLDKTWNGLRFIGTPPVAFGIPKGKQAEGWTLITLPASGGVESQFFPVADIPAAAVPTAKP